LDPKQIIEIRQMIAALGSNHTVILSTHILPEVSMVCNKVVIVNKGRVAMQSQLKDLSKEKSLEQIFVEAVSSEEKLSGQPAQGGA
jgi:ABC-2 type transport system ATP-binding protein